MINGSLFRSGLEIKRQTAISKTIALEQQKLSSGTRLLRGSENPAAASEIAKLKRSLSSAAVSQSNIAFASSLAAQAETNLAAGQTILDQAQEILQAAVSGTSSDSNRSSAAMALRQMATELRSLATAKSSQGDELFPIGSPNLVPVGKSQVAATISRGDAFNISDGGQSVSIADVLEAAAASLLSPSATAQERAVHLDKITAGSTAMALGRSNLGLTGLAFERMSTGIDESNINVQSRLNEIENVDIAQSMSRITSGQVTLQAAQALYAKLGQSSLFDLLR